MYNTDNQLIIDTYIERRPSYSKIVQENGMTKQNTQFLFFIPERSPSYSKIVQVNGMTKQNKVFKCDIFQH